VICYLGLGSNIADRANYLKRAVEELEATSSITVLRSSTIIETEPFGKTDQDNFLNCVLEIETELNPRKLLQACNQIEDQLGRVRKEKWGPRTIDIDILIYGEEINDSPKITLPHPGIHLRKFVLDSMVELCPDLVHPKLNKTIKKLHEEL